MEKIKIVWMDDQVKTFFVQTGSMFVKDGVLYMNVMDETQADREHGRAPKSGPRRVRYPLSNIRWYGDPGKEITW
jgi:hypothetical protein